MMIEHLWNVTATWFTFKKHLKHTETVHTVWSQFCKIKNMHHCIVYNVDSAEDSFPFFPHCPEITSSSVTSLQEAEIHFECS